MGGAFIDGLEITLEQALIAQGSETLQLGLPNPAAGASEGFERWFVRQLLVKRDQFARLVAAGVTKGPLDGRQFVGDENLGLVSFQEMEQRLAAVHVIQLERVRGGAEGDQSFRRSELARQRVPVAQLLRRFWIGFSQHRHTAVTALPSVKPLDAISANFEGANRKTFGGEKILFPLGPVAACRSLRPGKISRSNPARPILGRMHLARLRLRDFRNYARLDAEFLPGFHLLLGDNAMGKTNILEAIYLMATLRSFRGVGGAQMIRHGQPAYFVGGKVVGTATHEIKMYWALRERKLTLDSQPVRKLTDYLGVLRVVVFCTEDLQLVKGTGRSRRRFVDLLLSQTFPAYLPLLQRYARALRSRNALLKQRVIDEAALEGFTHELLRAGDEIISLRHQLIPRLSPLARLAYRRISSDAEELRIEYRPSVKKDFARELAQGRARERVQRLTLVGPHRDELEFFLNEQSAAQFGSEGQKRSLVVALKMAQAEYLTGLHGSPPVLLIDDVMGELDLKRRSGLLPLLERSHQARGQVFMTCTEENWPRELGRELHRWQVQAGSLRRMD